MAAPTAGGCSRACSRRSRPDDLRCYVIATGIIFALMFVAHVARFLAEGTGLSARADRHRHVRALSLGLAIWALIC